jgi:hypothetical protein
MLVRGVQGCRLEHGSGADIEQVASNAPFRCAYAGKRKLDAPCLGHGRTLDLFGDGRGVAWLRRGNARHSRGMPAAKAPGMHTATVATALLLAIGLLTPDARAAATTGAAPSSNTFEGDVTMRITTERSNGPQDVKVHVKGDKVRYDLPASASSQNQPLQAVFDMATKKVLMIMPEQRAYAVLDLNTIPPESRQATTERAEAQAANWTAAPTGTSKELAGHRCDQWQATNTKSNMKVDACLAPDVRINFEAFLPQAMLPPAWADKMRNGELPLSATVYSAEGKQTFNSQVTNVTRRTVPSSEFTPPADYKRVELPMSAFGNLMPTPR